MYARFDAAAKALAVKCHPSPLSGKKKSRDSDVAHDAF
jgi:hypothetical protein